VIRVVERNDDFEPVQFATFAPLALAAIGTLPGTLADRSVPLRMERKAASDTIVRLRDAEAGAGLGVLARKLARAMGDAAATLAVNPVIPAAMNDREGDLSVPLLSIADAAGGDWPERARRALLHLFRLRLEADEGTETGTQLLADIKSIFTEIGAERLTSATICERLKAMEDRPWPEWKNGKEMSATQLARALSPFRVKPMNMRLPGESRVLKGYLRDRFEVPWSRYLPADTPSPHAEGDTNRYTATSGAFPGFAGINGVATSEPCSGSEIRLDPNDSAGCSGVAAQNPDIEREQPISHSNLDAGGKGPDDAEILV
jgi:hypothetical protein